MTERTVFQSMAQRHVVSVVPTATVYSAACVMTRANCGSVLVIDSSNALLGIVTERDLMTRVVAKAIDPATATAVSYTHRDVYKRQVMVFPSGIMLESSTKNIYGVLPPATEDAERVEQMLVMDDRVWLADKTWALADGTEWVVGRYDGAVKLNHLERSFARALDEADSALWWHRNPDKHASSVRSVRRDHEPYFYPDFVVRL